MPVGHPCPMSNAWVWHLAWLLTPASWESSPWEAAALAQTMGFLPPKRDQAESSLPTSQSWPCLCLAIGGIGGPNQQTATSLDPSTSRFLVFFVLFFFLIKSLEIRVAKSAISVFKCYKICYWDYSNWLPTVNKFINFVLYFYYSTVILLRFFTVLLRYHIATTFRLNKKTLI